MGESDTPYVLAFDTANEVIALGLGFLDASSRSVELVAAKEIPAHRASNTQLLPQIDALLADAGIAKEEIACVACGRGPGSFTGVRICMATAKGIASALEVPLFGVSTLDAIAWQVWELGVRGHGVVAADAMRKEVYPVRYEIDDEGITRFDADRVAKAEDAAADLSSLDWISGDGLHKYADLFDRLGPLVDESLWTPTGKGLLLTVQAAWQSDEINPFDVVQGNPALALPVYTRLSDAEENERIRLSKNEPKNLQTGVQEEGLRRDQRAVSRDTAIINAQADDEGMVYRPLDAAHAADVAALENVLMGTDAWSEASIIDELPRKDRIWWAAYVKKGPSAAGALRSFCISPQASEEGEGSVSSKESEEAYELIAYAGGWVIDGQLQILKIATVPEFRGRGIARKLLTYLAVDGRDLGAEECSLEVRASNAGARAFYERLGLANIGTRPGYYSDREDAVIMEGALPLSHSDIAGMELQVLNEEVAEEGRAFAVDHPLILAIESSCDETAAAVVDGEGHLLSDVVASQIDFHARFGGVVPEIASRKHIEAICGVAQEALDRAAEKVEAPHLRWRDLDAVAVTYAPGLVGALVVGVAFAKGAAWGADLPFIGVNHLEGHIYANKIATPDVAPPMVVSLVSGGHTMLVHVKDWGCYKTLGSTLDDAVGEAFDKVAKVMGLGYPGGPAISKIAKHGDPRAIDFPRAMLHSGDLRFSLSGLKTAVISFIQKEEATGRTLDKADVAASFQQAVIDVQIAKARKALEQTGAKEFCLGGGVAANPALRAAYELMCEQVGVRLTLPPMSACTDNAGMIALVALDRYHAGKFFGLDADAHAHVDMDEPY